MRTMPSTPLPEDDLTVRSSFSAAGRHCHFGSPAGQEAWGFIIGHVSR